MAMIETPDWLMGGDTVVAPPAPAPAPPPPRQPPTLDPELVKVMRELRAREQSLASLTEFSRTYVNVEPALHHRLICDAVDDLVFNDKYDVLVVMSPPASAKSTYISIAAPAYIIAKRPDTRVISVSRAAELASEFGGKVKNIIEGDALRLASSVAVAQDTRAKDNWKTTAGGGYFAVGATGGVLGKRADIVITDDVHASFEEAQSETQLEKLRKWFEGDLLSRLTPTGKLIVIGQRLNANDIIGFVLARAKVNPRTRLKLLKFTAVCEDPDTDPLHRVKGERMWPEFYTDDYLHDKRQDDFIWRTMWMQEPPSDTGSWVSKEDIGHRPSPTITPDTPVYACSDLALSVNKGDCTVHLIVAIDTNGDWDIIDAMRSRVDTSQSASDVISLTTTYRPREWLIDDDNASKVFMPLVMSKAREVGAIVPWRPMPMRGQDKETRAAALRGQFKRHKVYYPADAHFAHWLTTEILAFPNAVGNGVDDGVDALSLMGRRMMAIAPATVTVVPTPKAGYSLDDLWDCQPKRSRRI